MRNATLPLAWGLFVLVAAHGVQAAVVSTQIVTPVPTSGVFAGGPTVFTVSRAGGQSLVFFGRYSSENPNESGVGLNIQYDPTKITSVVVDQVLTKCLVQLPATIAGATNTVQLDWADTSLRSVSGVFTGAVGWPSTADDPVRPCIVPPTCTVNPSDPTCVPQPLYVANTAAIPLPANLFRFTATMAAGFTTGNTTTITISSSSKSSALASLTNTTAFTNTSLVVTGLAVAPCDLDIDGDSSRLAFKDGILLVRYMLGSRGTSLTQGLTLTGSRTDFTTIEPFIAAQNYNVDAGTTATQAFIDGIILVRLMLGVADASLLNGITIPTGAAFTTPAAIRANVNATCGTSF